MLRQAHPKSSKIQHGSEYDAEKLHSASFMAQFLIRDFNPMPLLYNMKYPPRVGPQFLNGTNTFHQGVRNDDELFVAAHIY